jgi:hypothetical protein
MSRRIQITALSAALFLSVAAVANAQYGGSQYVRTQPAAADPIRAAVQTLLVQVDHLVEDMEVDLVRDPVSERLMTLAHDVQEEAEHLAASIESGVDSNHAVRDFQQFDVQWHRLSREALRVAANDRRLQRNIARVSQTDADLHRLLRVPVPVDVQEVRVLTAGLRRASAHLREDIETDLLGLWQQREILERAAALEESAEHLEVIIARGVDVRHMREDFETVDEAWLALASSMRELSPMRFDHVLRATTVVATTEGQLRAALGFEPNPEQFTCFRPAPTEVRSGLPYASSGRPVILPSGWRLVPATQPPIRTQAPVTTYRPTSTYPAAAQPTEPGLGMFLGLLFGGDSNGESRDRSPRRLQAETEGDVSGHEDDSDRPRPTIKKVVPGAAPVAPLAPATAPAKPIDPAVQAKIDKNFAKLSAKDRAAAIAQRTCPVMGQLLGTHGVPIRVSVKDDFGVRRDVFVCCEDCEEKMDDHPERYLKNLPE